MTAGSPSCGGRSHWLLPVDPAAHAAHLPPDWRTRPDAGAVWAGIGADQDVTRWCLRTGFRSLRVGDRIWAYLSRRQEIAAVGVAGEVGEDERGRFVRVDWDGPATRRLGAAPIPRAEFGQVPMSFCRANTRAAAVLDAWLRTG